MSISLAERLDQQIAAGRTLEVHTIEALAHELEIPLEEFERRLHGGGDAERDQRDAYQKMLEERIKFLQDDGE